MMYVLVAAVSKPNGARARLVVTYSPGLVSGRV